MPEYALSNEDMANLIAYLNRLSDKQDPGVDKKIYILSLSLLIKQIQVNEKQCWKL